MTTLHELGARWLRERGERIDWTAGDVFDRLADASARATRERAGQFDLLVIDEGQDFEPAWMPPLLGLVRNEGRALWLEDADQNLYRRSRVEPPGWVGLDSPVNYRSPRTLVTLIEMLGLVDRPMLAGSAVHGFDPELHGYYSTEDELLARTGDAVRSFLDAGHAPNDIAVLAWHGLARSRLFCIDTLAGRPVRRCDGRYTEDGDGCYTDGEVLVETVHRFKGQSADCVVIAGMDFDEWTDDVRRRLYVAMTRARLKVAWVLSESAEARFVERLHG